MARWLLWRMKHCRNIVLRSVCTLIFLYACLHRYIYVHAYKHLSRLADSKVSSFAHALLIANLKEHFRIQSRWENNIKHLLIDIHFYSFMNIYYLPVWVADVILPVPDAPKFKMSINLCKNMLKTTISYLFTYFY